ncbi:MAG TPA: Na+/H+ antiporter NhaA [Bacteroidia bacterium]|nr:Na+/H+ antiporter NhaA [Bacteroidia bacterium]
MKLSITAALREFIQSQKFSGVLLILCTVLSLSLANSIFSESYLKFWQFHFGSLLNGSTAGMSIEHFINDGLMAIFFLLVGLEIKREAVAGELSSIKKAAIPVAAAFGGMIIPALIYTAFNYNTPTASGWGIPMATDIAFAIGALSLLGKRVPDSLKMLLTALAVADDLGAVVVIALFYSSGISVLYLVLSGAVMVLLIILNLAGVRSLLLYLLPGLLLWYFMYCSGVHSAIAGVLLAMTIPFSKKEKNSPLLRLEHTLHSPVNFIIMPLFALANTAIILSSGFMDEVFSPEILGIGMGLVVGKPVGIILFISLALRFRIGKLPEGVTMKQVLGMGFLGGIGFTMSIFISLLAFSEPEYILNAKVIILASSFIAGLTGIILLKKAYSESA